ncbi:MAG: hypothetical protein ACOC9Y_05070, partial [Chloroflexota bacterium]
VRIWLEDSGKEHVFDGASTGETGVYTVDVTFPESGAWQWEVNQGPFVAQSLGMVDVQQPGASGSSAGDTSG